MSDADHLTTVDDRYWRMLFTEWADDLISPARAPEGRWHCDGQQALYLSGSPEGCVIATARYASSDDPPRGLYPLRVRSSKIVDLRDSDACAFFDIDTTHRRTEWQLDRARGRPAPTWAISDRVRTLNLDGMLYASRKNPSKTHLTLFQWTAEMDSAKTAAVCADGPVIPWQNGRF